MIAKLTLNNAQTTIMEEVEKKDGITSKKIHKKLNSMGLKRKTIQSGIKALEEEGVVITKGVLGDARSYHIFKNPKYSPEIIVTVP